MLKAKQQMARPLRKPNAQHVTRRRPEKEKPKSGGYSIGLARESATIVLVFAAVFLALSLYSYLHAAPGATEAESDPHRNIMGWVGDHAAHILISLLGWCSFVTVLWALLLARTIWNVGWPTKSASFLSLITSSLASLCMTIACASIACVLVGYPGGGALGAAVSFRLVRYINEGGTLLISLAVFFLSLGVATGVGTSQIVSSVRGVGGQGVGMAGDSFFLLRRISAFFAGLVASILRFLGTALKGAFWMLPIARREAGIKRVSRDRREERRSKLLPLGGSLPASGSRVPDEFVLGTVVSNKIEGPIELDLPLPTPLPSPQEDPLILRRSALELEEQRKKKSELKKSDKTIFERGKNRRGEKGDREAYKEPEVAKVYEFPDTALLVGRDIAIGNEPRDDELIQNSRRLEQALSNFRISGRVVEVHPGPVVTLYQYEPGPGVKVQRIISLADDLALALKVGSVRVFAPVPGKGTVGIEVPNAHREIVRLREILESEEYRNRPHVLALALGKDTYGAPFVADLASMPHLLIAGATGTGKSVCINSLLISLIFKNTPDELRLLMIDPKMLELSVYEDIPHLYAPVVTHARRARGVLWWAVQEMERRYSLMKELGVRDVAMFNRAVTESKGGNSGRPPAHRRSAGASVIELEERDVIATGSERAALERSHDLNPHLSDSFDVSFMQPLPRIVIIVDELADLMLTVGREIEELLTRLAQKARAAGIHLILATQRPSVDVITGLIKANFPARISFKVASKIDARTVMDLSGAEKLLGQGDMLYLSAGVGRVKRLHSPYISDKEVHDVVEWMRGQGRPKYDPLIQQMIARFDESELGGPDGGETQGDEYDTLYDQAVRLVIDKGAASTSMVQRAFRIGYNRAARILELMERDGIVGPADGAKPRQVLVGGEGS